MIKTVFLMLACAVALISANIISWATAPVATATTIKIATSVKASATSVRASIEPVRVVYAGYGQVTAAVTASRQTEQPAISASPSYAERTEPTSLMSPTAPVFTKTKATTLIDLNTASLEELNASGGGKIGKAIVRGRPYQKLDDLVAKRVISRATLQSIKARVSISS